MAHPIVMPSFGMYTAEGTLVGWLHRDGAPVTIGQTIAEVETEKAVQELPCPATGILCQVAQPGALLKVESLLGFVLAPGEARPGVPNTPNGGPPVEAPTTDRPPVKATPIAKRLAAEHRVDLSSVSGSGPGGRIVEADILARVNRSDARVDSTPLVATSRAPLSSMRRTIGERLRRGLSSAVPVTLTREVDADRLVSDRLATAAQEASAVPLDAYFIKLLAAAMREHPALNATIEDGDLLAWADINVGVAVSLTAGLIVPVIRHADRKPLSEIGDELRSLAARARAGDLRADETAGATCTMTNLGAASVDAFTPVLNPPQSCVLGVGRIRPRAVPRGTEVVVAQTCVLSLTFDHRVTDGAPAAALLDAIARRMDDDEWFRSLH